MKHHLTLFAALWLVPAPAMAQSLAAPAPSAQEDAVKTEKAQPSVKKPREIKDVNAWGRTVPPSGQLDKDTRSAWNDLGQPTKSQQEGLESDSRNTWRATRAEGKEQRRFGQNRFDGPYNILPRRYYPSPARRGY
ncbi:hypothetical protein GC177_06260 [bacterium]|nr:hypothetical protein [bacterium]